MTAIYRGYWRKWQARRKHIIKKFYNSTVGFDKLVKQSEKPNYIHIPIIVARNAAEFDKRVKQ
jgi:hypothetical protein